MMVICCLLNIYRLLGYMNMGLCLASLNPVLIIFCFSIKLTLDSLYDQLNAA